jgi:GNAT superfamily N-acetyltransferase
MKRQKAGKAVYFLALLGKEPVGHIFLNYGKDNEWYEDVVLEDLYVRQDQRKKGFASEIMEYAERFVSQKGFSEMGLDVETHEHWIKKFYEGIGYVEVSGPHDLVYEGEKGKVREKIVHLRKQL